MKNWANCYFCGGSGKRSYMLGKSDLIDCNFKGSLISSLSSVFEFDQIFIDWPVDMAKTEASFLFKGPGWRSAELIKIITAFAFLIPIYGQSKVAENTPENRNDLQDCSFCGNFADLKTVLVTDIEKFQYICSCGLAGPICEERHTAKYYWNYLSFKREQNA